MTSCITLSNGHNSATSHLKKHEHVMDLNAHVLALVTLGLDYVVHHG